MKLWMNYSGKSPMSQRLRLKSSASVSREMKKFSRIIDISLKNLHSTSSKKEACSDPETEYEDTEQRTVVPQSVVSQSEYRPTTNYSGPITKPIGRPLQYRVDKWLSVAITGSNYRGH